MRQGIFVGSLLCALFIAAPSQATVLLPNNLVIGLPFEGDFDNQANGAASAGALGNVTNNQFPITFESDPSDPGRGQYIRWPGAGQFSDLAFNDVAIANVAGSTGFTWSMFTIWSGIIPNVPAWFFNATGTTAAGNTTFGVRINSGVNDYRAASAGGFFGSGPASQTAWQHIAYVVEPSTTTGKYRAKFYVDGALNDMSGEFDEITNLSGGLIGGWTLGGEWRMFDALMDEFRLYNVAMDAGQIAQLATELLVPEPATMSLMLLAAGCLARRSRRRLA